MQRNATVRMDFPRLRNADLSVFALSVHDHLSGNAHFPSPPVPLDTLLAQAEAFQQAISSAMEGAITDKEHMRAARKTLLGSLRILARYVQQGAGTDVALIVGAGFQPTATQKLPVKPLARPIIKDLKVERQRGTIHITINAVAGARSYTAIIEPVAYDGHPRMDGKTIHRPEGIAAVCNSVQRKMTIGGLSSGVRYRAMVAAVGTPGMSPLSAPVEFIPQ